MEGSKCWMLNLKKLEALTKTTLEVSLRNNPKHFRIGSKDYLIINTKKRLYITDRRGNVRVKVPETLKVSSKEIFVNKNSFVTIDKSNNLVRMNLNGEVSIKPLPLDTPYLITASNNILVTISENILTINENIIELPFGNYTNPKILTGGEQEYVSITDKDQDKIYLFDSQSKSVSGYAAAVSIFSVMDEKKEKIIRPIRR